MKASETVVNSVFSYIVLLSLFQTIQARNCQRAEEPQGVGQCHIAINTRKFVKWPVYPTHSTSICLVSYGVILFLQRLQLVYNLLQCANKASLTQHFGYVIVIVVSRTVPVTWYQISSSPRINRSSMTSLSCQCCAIL